MPIDLRFDPAEIALFTDLYELTVGAAFFAHGMNDAATFELSARRLPPGRGYMVAAGIERLVEALEEYRFDSDAIAHLESLHLLPREFLDYLAGLRFSGTVRAMPEGSICFGGEPLVQVHAPLIEAQVIETIVINQIGFPTMVASKAARCAGAAQGRRLVDFGPRRAQGTDASLLAARAAYLGGFDGTANVLAGKRYGVPVFGTMSHSFIMAHDQERAAFEDFAGSFPALSTLLVDTYDTLRGVEIAAEIGAKMRERGLKLQGIRLDSGDLRDLANRARRILDRAGLKDVAIFASGNLDEHRLAELMDAHAPIDAFGVGTALVVSDDAPAGDFTYKLAEYGGRPRLKTSAGKVSMPGRKQVFRALDNKGVFYTDLVGTIEESVSTVSHEYRPIPAQVIAMLEPVMENGKRVMPRPTLATSRERAAAGLESLEARYRSLKKPAEYPVHPTAAMNAMIIGERLNAERRQE